MIINQQQRNFFETFGYLVLPGAVADDILWITNEFEGVFTDLGIVHDPKQRTVIVPFIDQRERFCTLLDHPVINGIAAGLLGDGYNYLGGDGNYYTGDTRWHSDGFHTVGSYLKIALYLDPVTRDSGCLRVIPGSHRIDLKETWDANKALRAPELWGIEQRDVPAVALESKPGDVVAFNHNIMHAAFGGDSKRRMFTLNLNRRCETTDEVQDLVAFISGAARFWKDKVHSDIMRKSASPERWRHLRQPMDHEGHLVELVAKARAEMAEPARG